VIGDPRSVAAPESMIQVRR